MFQTKLQLKLNTHIAFHDFLFEKTFYPLYRRLGGPHGRSGQVRKISPPPGFDPRTVQPVARLYTDYATQPTFGTEYVQKKIMGDCVFCVIEAVKAVPYFSVLMNSPSQV